MAVHRLSFADAKLVDSFTDADVLRERVPRMDQLFRAIETKRKIIASDSSSRGVFTRASGFTPQKDMQYAATVPVSVFAAMLEIDPEFGTDEKKFIAWLKRNPQFAATEKVP